MLYNGRYNDDGGYCTLSVHKKKETHGTINYNILHTVKKKESQEPNDKSI